MSELSGAREAVLIEAANTLLDARRSKTPIVDLPVDLQPTTMDEAYFVQDTMKEAYGEVGGWKIGAPTPEATPLFGPMPAAWIVESGSVLRGFRYRGIESEIAFLLGADLPVRTIPYTMDETVAAIASCHPVIEVVDSGLLDPTVAARLSMIADMQMHGGFVYGPAYTEWKSLDFKTESVVLAVDGVVRVEKTGSNTSGNLMRLLPWLANEGAARTGGLRAGQWITTGSWTGCLPLDAESSADVQFAHAGRVTLRFE